MFNSSPCLRGASVRLRIVVADEANVRFYDLVHEPQEALQAHLAHLLCPAPP